MATRNVDSSQGDGCIPSALPGPPDQQRSRAGNMVFKSGPLFLSSKGIGWTSWKKRWFILTRTSLVFFRSDPNVVPQKGSEVNLTLGGIDLNNSGSVVVKEDKKLLTVLFPDGRDGRTFTLKAETLEDLHEWTAALENALAQAPSAALVVGQNGIFKQDQADAVDGSLEQVKDKLPGKHLVVGRPILLALEDVDGSPSFLEKALRFIEEHGVKVEGILRQAADVEDVERRVQEYEQGNIEFSSSEDPHVVADCVKLVLRELPSSPVPASCCDALLEACRTVRAGRVGAMRTAICETFPEPNHRLLQRILMMMQTVASNKAANRMSSSAVAACMAPLLLRPLLAGDCELENDFDVGGDGSVQLLQAAAAANHAQAIVITLLEEYDKIFGEGSISQELYSDSDESRSQSAEPSDDDDRSFEHDEHELSIDDLDDDSDLELASRRSYSEGGGGDSGNGDLYENKSPEASSSNSEAPETGNDLRVAQKASPSSPRAPLPENDNSNESNDNSAVQSEPGVLHGDISAKAGAVPIEKSASISNVPDYFGHPSVLGRTLVRKNLSMESIDYPLENEAEIERLMGAKLNLQNMIEDEVKRNSQLQASLERRKRELQERRFILEQDVVALQKQLQQERDLTSALEAGLKTPHGPLPISATIDEGTKADLEEVAIAEADICDLKKKFDNLEFQLNQQREQNRSNHDKKPRDKHKNAETSTSSPHLERSTRSKAPKDGSIDGVDIHEASTLPNKRRSETRNSTSPDTSAPEPVKPTAPTNSKKNGMKGEGAYGISKLTARLNFLKERRTQTENELQNFEKGRGVLNPSSTSKGGSSSSEPTIQTPQTIDEQQESLPNNSYSQNVDNGGETGVHHSSLGRSLRRRSRGSNGPKPERVRSEGHHLYRIAERGSASEGVSHLPPRTNSR